MDLFDTARRLAADSHRRRRTGAAGPVAVALSNADVFERLLIETPWREESVVVYGKRHLQPRLTAWYGDASYTYSGLRLEPLPWTALLLEIRAAVEAACGQRFNSVLLNRYRNERDSMGMHSDDEAGTGHATLSSLRSVMARRAPSSCATNATNGAFACRWRTAACS